ncbi:MAG: chloride channel protein, partial [bacterium]
DSERQSGPKPPRWSAFGRLRLPLGAQTSMMLVALIIGLVGGGGAIAFRWLIETFQTLAWGSGGTALEKIARAPWHLKIIVPAAGGLLVGLIVKFFAPEARGHGVPEVMYATARRGGVIRPIVAAAKSLASAICIATGGSVGREGPIVQIGSALASSIGQVLRLSSPRLRICVGCGAAAGIAATFNAPIAGAFFAAEVVLGGFSAGAFGPIVISSVAATVVSRSAHGDLPAFLKIPAYSLVSPAEMITYTVLGLCAALAAVGFVTLLYHSETVFEKMKVIPDYLQPVIGGVGIGILGIWLPQVMGVGYDTITPALRGELLLGFLLALLAAKLLATSLTLGSGGSGGVFAPSLFMGAALGGAVGQLAQLLLPWSMASPGAYAVVGMGAMVAATTHAPITAILIIFELTGDYRVILPLMVSCILGHLVARFLQRESIYTIKLMRRGIDLQAGHELNVLRRILVADLLNPSLETVSQKTPLDELHRRMVESPHYEFFIVDNQGALVGVVSVDDLRRSLPDHQALRSVVIAEDIGSSPVHFVRENDTLDCAMRQFGKRNFEELPVLPAGDAMTPIGTIRRQDIIKAYNKEILKVDLAGSISSRLGDANRLQTWETVGGYVVAQMEAPHHLCGHDLQSLQLRQKRGIQVILIERAHKTGDERFVFPTPDAVLEQGDNIVVFGKTSDVERLSEELH